MNNWKQISIGDFIDFNPSESLPKGKEAKKIPMAMLTEYVRKISGFEISEYNSGPKFRNGDTLVAKITPCLENGKTAQVDILEDNEVAFGSSEFIVLRENDNSINEYIYYLAKSPVFRERAISCMEGTSGRKRVNEGALKRQEIIVPDKNIQQKIAKVLSDLDTKIELNNKINAELEAMAKTLFNYWFVQFDFPDMNGKPYKSSGGKMVWNEELKREIPEGWGVDFLTNEMDLQYGFPFSTNLFNENEEGVPIIRIRDILNCTISNYSTEKVDEKYKLFKGDILVGMDGNFHINYWNKENCYLNQRTLRIRATENSISEIQARFSIEPYIKAREKNVSRTTVGHLSAKDVNGLKILKATSEIQYKANDFFKSTLKKIISNSIENQELASLRDWLLPMLMNGQIKLT
ncbi:type I restriction enzyme S subunit [Flavobacterium sp. HSC-32F16]|uniref:restriction endonuclease subunit S n=1 Tax=Flavobacterium sp. HSC-32F16 TaxID=2910964 RepID=UPI0020A2E4ED|nr:restriction endonuclease subunit S [Flavobacterium sp. HSC-32F16]MCP2027420.1 type I restriction enzyme S subunit [Flavobacterium sp. HSC-32F16]